MGSEAFPSDSIYATAMCQQNTIESRKIFQYAQLILVISYTLAKSSLSETKVKIIQRGRKTLRCKTSALHSAGLVGYTLPAMASYLSLAALIISSLSFSRGFWLGDSSKEAITFHRGSQLGFEKNPNVYAHLVIPPWNRPFKPGYCVSWEWHTDKKYRDRRVAICKEQAIGEFHLP